MTQQIKGYRELDETEVETINALKELEGKVNSMIGTMKKIGDFDQRLVAIGATQIELGLMALVKSVARPTSD